ncbi:hypothetical protein ZYGR_0AI06450 [Zygosaccharomyces rouxii]|uniref:Dystroglycan-type cadherin-like domain-containing protein n=1 Tax=Zygosaccharomyces rouxii TaxID=4956 RepID=A0A1Q3ACJ8_ZYGRO|nr:hypothetical protein ZYGR_0AI06450 [Zygosaccharomyces rouxii]
MRDIQILVLLVVLSFGPLAGVRSQPMEGFPLDAQWPPVARVGKAFEFQISGDTFQSTSAGTQISYEAFDLPSWLSFDSGARTFKGTPQKDDLKNGLTTRVPVTLQGTDPGDNKKLNKSYDLVVTSKTSVDVASNFNLLALLKNYGSTNGQGGLILKPNQEFNITFDRDSFTNQDYITEYYGISEPFNTPLPSWMVFDENNLKFSGVTPVAHSEIAPQIAYQFAIGATDVNGYASASIPFSIVVGAHELTTSIQNTLMINVSKSGDFDYQLPLDYVFLDNETISNNDLGSIETLNAPKWVSLDNGTLSGKMPMDSGSPSKVNFSVVVHDTFDDSIYWNFEVASTHDLFATHSLPNINATRDEWFQYNFLPSQFTNINDTEVSVNFTNSSQNHDWINFKSSNLTLMGKVPDDFESLSIGLVAQENSQRQQLGFKLVGMDSRKHRHNHTTSSSSHSSHHHPTSSSSGLSSTSRSSSATATSSSGTAALMPSKKNHSGKNTAAIAAGVTVPVVVLAVAALFFLLWWRRRHNDTGIDTEKSPDISSPDTDNPANKPNQRLSENPFSDGNAVTNPEAFGALATTHSGRNSLSGSDISTLDEKRNASDASGIMQRELTSPSSEMLLPTALPISHSNESNFFNPNDRSSSVYRDSEPALQKSWRYSENSKAGRSLRDSIRTNSTVSTVDLFNTVLKEDQPIPKDPRKSTLGQRDSVFLNNKDSPKKTGSRAKYASGGNMLPILDEQSHDSNYKANTAMTMSSSSSSDELIPMQENGKFNWVSKSKAKRTPSKKRLVQTQNESNVDVGQADEIEGHVPEQI